MRLDEPCRDAQQNHHEQCDGQANAPGERARRAASVLGVFEQEIQPGSQAVKNGEKCGDDKQLDQHGLR